MHNKEKPQADASLKVVLDRYTTKSDISVKLSI